MFLFSMKELVLFGTDRLSMYFISTIFLKNKMNWVHVTQFKISYIHYKTHLSHKKLVKLCFEVHSMWWGNQYLELQEWEDCINTNKNNTSYYYVSTKEESTGIQIICHFDYFHFLWRRCYYHWLDCWCWPPVSAEIDVLMLLSNIMVV